VGACGLCVSSDGLVVTFVVAGWIEWGLNSPLLHRDRDRNPVGGAVLATGAPLPPGHPATHAGGREPVVRWVYDRGYFWVGDAAAAAALAVPAGGPGPGYAPLPRGLGPQLERLREYYQFVPGRPAFVFVNGDARSTDDNPWLAWAFARLRRPAVSLPTTRYFYYDGPAADLRPVRGADGHGYTEDPSFAAGPRNLAVLVNHPGEPRATLTLWELPPPRPPWAWSVPAGVALGVLLTAAGVRLRRRRPNRT